MSAGVDAARGEAHALLGAVLQLRGHPAEAVHEYDRASAAFPDDIDPDNARAVAERVEVLVDLGRVDDACADAVHSDGIGELGLHEQVALRMWGTLLPPGGAQRPHHHPLGHLSGVVYLPLPEAMQADDPLAGALEFGRPQPVHVVEPLPGRVVIFPSHLWHATRAFDAPGLRISLAFDVVSLEA